MYNISMNYWLSLLAIINIIICQSFCQDFGYSGNSGPIHWGEKFASCLGKHQSPIDIIEHLINYVDFDPLKFQNFEMISNVFTLTNNGHTVIGKIQNEKMPELSGGPLVGTYRFEQFHFHWGKNDKEGSENKINNNSYPLELHMVLYNNNYTNLQEATKYRDGLTVLSFLFKVVNTSNSNYDLILQLIKELKNPNTTITTHDVLKLETLITTDKKKYFTYDGSLTTPPCSEVVTWIEFKKPIGLSHEQLQLFRNLYNKDGRITHNFRPTQPLHDRIVYYCSDDEKYDVLHSPNVSNHFTPIHILSNSGHNKLSLFIFFISVLTNLLFY